MAAKKLKNASAAASEFCRIMPIPREMRSVVTAAFMAGAAWAYSTVKQGVEKDHIHCSRRIDEIFGMNRSASPTSDKP